MEFLLLAKPLNVSATQQTIAEAVTLTSRTVLFVGITNSLKKQVDASAIQKDWRIVDLGFVPFQDS